MLTRSLRRKGPNVSNTDTRSNSVDSFPHSTAAILVGDGTDDPRGPLGLHVLHSPAEPLAELIFVHGLGGGSRKTWSKESSSAHFWPKEWLSKDTGFKNVRIHTFGYNSDWAKSKENFLNVHHIGKSFLSEMSTSPYLDGAGIPIVFVGHDLGGLVIKKAYMLAKKDASYEKLSRCFQAIFFLGTPHRGLDGAKVLNNIIHVAYSRAYATDLERKSAAIQSINDEFRHFSADIQLWSFYETQKLSIGLFSSLVVNPESATLGYREEKQMPMNADHQSICKFESPSDPNYLIIRNALASAVNGLIRPVFVEQADASRDQLQALESYLSVSQTWQNDLVTVEDARMSGTCEWLAANKAFLEWADESMDSPKILWINGKPAAGKSVLAGFVIDQVQKHSLNCSYYFFKHGDKSKSRLSYCLRSLAFQMASTDAQVRKVLVAIQREGIKLDDNESMIWHTLFLSRIFKVQTSRHYWVIDALDECSDAISLLDPMLMKLDNSIPLRIMMTSQQTPELEKNFSMVGKHRFAAESIPAANTLTDIRVLVEARASSLVVKDDDDRTRLVEKILQKSSGSFLWTTLVLKELSGSHSETEINRVLEDMPLGMKPLYERVLEAMTQASRGTRISKAILTWTACSTRPLTTRELEGALKLDVNGNFLKLDETIAAFCGQLVTVDKFGKVRLIHETARGYLFDGDLQSEFKIDKTEAHTRIARACLAYLNGQEMKPPRTARRGANASSSNTRTEFSKYVFSEFAYHLAKADSLDDGVLELTEKFLKSNILSWIEAVAQTQNLSPLIRASNHLKTYLNARAGGRLPLGPPLQTIRGWTIDLIRIAAKFSDALKTSPSAIFTLIAPFCPSESMIHKLSRYGRRLSVRGISNNHWDDRLSSMDFRQSQASAVCYGEEFLAVGLITGTIALYHAATCQEYKTLIHGETVKFLTFKKNTSLMVSSGMRVIRVWDTRSSALIHEFEAPRRPMAVAFDDDLLLVASSKNFLESWDLGNNGEHQTPKAWNNCDEFLGKPLRSPPSAISMSMSHRMMAVAYSGQPITLWDLEEEAYYGSSGKKLENGATCTHPITALCFNPNPDIELLAVSYLDGTLVLLNPFDDLELDRSHANCHTLASSADGRLLAGGAGFGILHIYEFATLKLLYQVRSENFHIKQISFNRSGLHLADIRGSQCNVWEPGVLLRDAVADDSSDGSSGSTVEAITSNRKNRISAMAINTGGEVVFCAKDDGSVSLYDRKTGAHFRTLYRHKSAVRFLSWWSRQGIILSINASNGVLAWRIGKHPYDGWVTKEALVQSRLDVDRAIIQVFHGEARDKFVLATRESDHLWSLDGKQEQVQTRQDRPWTQRWAPHPRSEEHAICFDGTEARILCWEDWSEVTRISLIIPLLEFQPKSVSFHGNGTAQKILMETGEAGDSARMSSLFLFDSDAFDIQGAGQNATTKTARSTFSTSMSTISDHVAHIIGVSDAGRMVFLDKQSWVCSVELQSLGASPPTQLRHFFVPYDWFSGERGITCAVSQRDILFGHNDELAIVKGGLEYAENVSVEEGLLSVSALNIDYR
ncbi:NACHT and WD domain protein [Pseudomassariella vexata]|uniref:NACHT and WD domain protein n=1 Tax=Pseudomassariella vexata TaxID=1141098 RepID=A0A1Y2E4A3_9PEZI|nr:NACHT and WD domain protein [Pseudomassariella vexata]ORY66267.1 NACHT and WD domain protein [Pseudomassariella vexata]